MADPCCNSFGGRISIEIDGKRIPPTEADITLNPSTISVEGKANQDGSSARIVTPKLPKMDIKFRNSCGWKWDEVMRKCAIKVTVVEEDNNRTHLQTGAFVTGDPQINLKTGEVEGVSIEGGKYQKI